MKKLFRVLLLFVFILLLFLSGCSNHKPPNQAPDLRPPQFDFRGYECKVGDWCPSYGDLKWIITSVATCHHNKFVDRAQGKARSPYIPPIDWRKIEVLDECSSSWDNAGNIIKIYAGKGCSYTQGKTAAEMKRIIKRAVGHAEHHNSLPDGNNAHCQEGCDGWACQEWCECLEEVGF